jgi:hypothetical protein
LCNDESIIHVSVATFVVVRMVEPDHGTKSAGPGPRRSEPDVGVGASGAIPLCRIVGAVVVVQPSRTSRRTRRGETCCSFRCVILKIWMVS